MIPSSSIPAMYHWRNCSCFGAACWKKERLFDENGFAVDKEGE